jgi:hypothetical protein
MSIAALLEAAEYLERREIRERGVLKLHLKTEKFERKLFFMVILHNFSSNYCANLLKIP